MGTLPTSLNGCRCNPALLIPQTPHLLNATYAAQAFAEMHDGLIYRSRTHVVQCAPNRCSASERYIAVGSRVEGMPSWHQHSTACVQPAKLPAPHRTHMCQARALRRALHSLLGRLALLRVDGHGCACQRRLVAGPHFFAAAA
jgi:hypothetical protein